MSYLLLWAESLAVAILIVAIIAALAGRCKRQLWRQLWPVLAAVVQFLIVVAAVTVLAGILLVRNVRPDWLFSYLLALTIAYILGTGLVLRRGFRSPNQEPAARAWPRARLAVALGLVLAAWLVTLHLLDVNRQIELANVRTETAAKTLNIFPSRPLHHQNAAPLYEMVEKTFVGWKKLPHWFHFGDVASFDPNKAEAKQFLQEKSDVLVLLRQAAARPAYYYHLDISNLPSTPVPPLSTFRVMSKLLVLEAQSKTLAGDANAAMKDLAVIKRMAEHLRSIPFLISFVISGVVDHIGAQGLEYVLAHTSSLPQDLAPSHGGYTRSRREYFMDAFRMEGLINLQEFALIMPSCEEAMSAFTSPVHHSFVFRTLLPLWRVYLTPSELSSLREKWNELVKIMAKPYYNYQRDLPAWEEAQKKEPGGVYTYLYFQSRNWIGYNSRAAWSEAIQGLVDLAFATTAYKEDHGGYPARFEDLVPAYIKQIPTDPFDGKLLKMKAVEGGLCLFSIGLDPKKEPIDFYLGRAAYEKYRAKPAQQKRDKLERMRKKRKSKK
jgi:hypothetical protein